MRFHQGLTFIEFLIHDTLVFIYVCFNLQYADGDEFILAHMNALDNACQDTIYRNISNYKQGNNGELIFTSTSMVENCPNNCNRQGKCVRGSCVCSHGYTSVDCSVPVGVAPLVDHIQG